MSSRKNQNITDTGDDDSDQDIGEAVEVLSNVEKKVYQKSPKKRPYRKKNDSDLAGAPGYMAQIKKYVVALVVPLVTAYMMSTV